MLLYSPWWFKFFNKIEAIDLQVVACFFRSNKSISQLYKNVVRSYKCFESNKKWKKSLKRDSFRYWYLNYD